MVEGKLAEETVEAVSAGFEHVVALTKQGVLYVWGSNDRGQLGTGEDAAYHMVPTQIGGSVFGIKFAHIAAGLKHCIVASKSGEVYAWGANDFGQLGLGDVEDRKNPAAILSKFTRSRISRVAAGAHHSMAVTDNGDIFTWGSNECGQLGYELRSVLGPRFVKFPRKLETIRGSRAYAGFSMSAAIITSGKAFIWGCNGHGQLGIGDDLQRTLPHVLPAPGGVQFATLALGANHVLGVNKNGELYGWGNNDRGQMGLAYTTPMELKPVLISSLLSSDVEVVVTGGYAYEMQGHTLALTATGKLFTWGWNAFGQSGLGNLDLGSATPNRLLEFDPPIQVLSMATGQYNSIISTIRKGVPSIHSWGPNYDGQLGQYP
ncbi:hypothetical protein CBR_g6400 [Chara braunii]|uniref:RCC1-like domain-containing protein n=1 Tax=Chara braunii TaxID=69332 RepID=A0A388KJY2_CHABU|nr:hypothetical protein CBR_g6400 [Chara braunii]|eukprot:GBG70273.1 hypothetical protein CBR_g6400 [Chara braunii]